MTVTWIRSGLFLLLGSALAWHAASTLGVEGGGGGHWLAVLELLLGGALLGLPTVNLITAGADRSTGPRPGASGAGPRAELVERLPFGVAVYDAEGQLIHANRRYRELSGEPPEAVDTDVGFAPGAAEGPPEQDSFQVREDGRELLISPRPGEDGTTLVLCHDVSGAGLGGDAGWQRALSQLPAALLVLDTDAVLQDWNPAAADLLGLAPDRDRGRTLRSLLPSREADGLLRSVHGALGRDGRWEGEMAVVDAEQREITLDGCMVPLTDPASGQPEGLLLLGRGRPDRDAVRQRRDFVANYLDFVTNYDHLTGLPNRVLFLDRLEQALSWASWQQRRLAVLVIELDNFALINEGFGPEKGDRVLQLVAARLGEVCQHGETLARLGADKFALIQTRLKRPEQAAFRARHAVDLLEAPLQVDGRDLTLKASVGIGVYPEDGRDATLVLRSADVALARAKVDGPGSYRFYVRGMDEQTKVRCALEHDIRGALERQEFIFHYQPQVDLRTNRVIGCEALVRWHHPEFGLLSPDQFIPVAEENGSIIALGEWGLREACRQLKAWRDAGLGVDRVAVNLSAVQFRSPHLVQTVAGALERSGLDPAHLELEITESVALADPDQAVATLGAIRDLGVALAIDDFGAGYSSLGYLKSLPVQALKLDRSLVCDLDVNPCDASIITAVVGLAHSLRMQVVAEGIETDAQLHFLRRQRCDFGQGLRFSRPLEGEQFAAHLQRQDVLAAGNGG